jgi:hypothetical protein
MWLWNSTCDTDLSEAILFSEIKKGTQMGPLFDSRVSFRKAAQLAEICYCAASILVKVTSLLASSSSDVGKRGMVQLERKHLDKLPLLLPDL